MGTLIGLLIFVLILLIAIFAVEQIVAFMNLPPNAVKIIKLVVGLLALLWLLQQFVHPWGGYYIP